MLLEVLVEELSAEEAMRILLPRLVGPGVTFEVHSFHCFVGRVRALVAA